MNERIRLLAEQAGMRTVTYEYDEDTYFTDSLDPQKFAELIVRECANVAVNADSGMFYTADAAAYVGLGRQAASKLIKQHFGVEE